MGHITLQADTSGHPEGAESEWIDTHREIYFDAALATVGIGEDGEATRFQCEQLGNLALAHMACAAQILAVIGDGVESDNAHKLADWIIQSSDQYAEAIRAKQASS